jgi:integrase
MADRIDTVESRSKLKPRTAPYWQKISGGCALGFRKMTKQSDGTWQAQFYDSSTKEQTRQSLGSFSDLQPNLRFDQAKKKAELFFEHLRQGGNAEVISVGDACRRYCKTLIQMGKSKTAIDNEARFKRWVYKNKIANIHLTKLRKDHLEEWRFQLKSTDVVVNPHSENPITRTRADSTLNRDMAALRAALNNAKENGWVTSDMAWRKPLRPVENATGRRKGILDKQQKELLISMAQTDIGAYLKGLSLLPFRPGALANLLVSNIDQKSGCLVIKIDKGKNERRIILPPVTLKFFIDQTKDKLPSAPLLSRADGAAWNKDSWKKPIKAAVKSAGLPLSTSAYTLRHTTITELVIGGLDLLSVAQLAGTSVAMIEKHYGHFRAEHAAKALEKLA